MTKALNLQHRYPATNLKYCSGYFNKKIVD